MSNRKRFGYNSKTAWKMLHKIRQYMAMENNHTLSDEVEIDEAFVGGKTRIGTKIRK